MDAAIRRRAGGSAFTARSTVRNIAFAAMAPTLLPQIVRRVTGRPADSPEFLDEYAEQLRRVIERLR